VDLVGPLVADHRRRTAQIAYYKVRCKVEYIVMVKKITTDPQDELLTQVDEDNHLIGSISRGEAHETAGVFYRTIYVLVKNDKGEVLVQKRSSTKDLYPDCWDLSVGGHVNFGKSYEETAARELKEELGLDVTQEDLLLKGEVLVRLPKTGEYFHIFVYNLKPGETISPSNEEINEIRWITIGDMKKSMDEQSLKWYTRPLQVISALY